ncbi:MAG: pyridoxal phosphate-dependent aminotransferase [Polyangiaceae bacterium]|nr:pyridoxal phosphate-dependent aminotransferase [Polyangiaceae bacterium]
MFADTSYLRWARTHFEGVRYNLGSSGEPTQRLDLTGIDVTVAAGPGHLIDAVARHNQVSPEECHLALGASHGLFLAFAALLTAGDDAIVETPTYEPLLRVPEGLGARVIALPRPAHRNYAIDPAELAALMTPRTRVVAVTNLHNPSGARTPDDVLRELAAIAAAQDAYLLVDEVYGSFDALTDDAGIYRSSARRLGANVIAVSSLTKTFGLGPTRIGWVLAPPELRETLEAQLTANVGILAFDLANIGVRAFEQLPQLRNHALARRGTKRERVDAWLRARGLAWSAPREGLFGFVRAPNIEGLGDRIDAGIARHDVVVVPGRFFGDPQGFRLAWTLDEADLDGALERLGRVLDGE